MNDQGNCQAGELASAQGQHVNPPPHRILVVDDDTSVRQLNRDALIQSGYDADAAENGAVAWHALNADSYDLIITDNSMPKVSGVELLQKLHAARMVVPVIMATGILPDEIFARFPWLKPNATLLKPYTVGEMLNTVKRVLCELYGPEDTSRPFVKGGTRSDILSSVGKAAGTPRRSATSSPHPILVVDKDSDLRQLYADALVHPHYAVNAVEDGAVAWEALQARNYNLLITEHDLPRVTGIELIRKLRAARMEVPVVMAAARLPMHELARNPSLQLAAMLSKPFEMDALLETVNNVLRRVEMRLP